MFRLSRSLSLCMLCMQQQVLEGQKHHFLRVKQAAEL